MFFYTKSEFERKAVHLFNVSVMLLEEIAQTNVLAVWRHGARSTGSKHDGNQSRKMMVLNKNL